MMQKQPGVPFALKEGIEVQADAVVSKTLFKNDAGSVTLFAFGAGQTISTHTAPFDATVLVLDGAAQITVAGKEAAVRAGELIFMPAGLPHGLRADQPFKMLLTMLKAGQRT